MVMYKKTMDKTKKKILLFVGLVLFATVAVLQYAYRMQQQATTPVFLPNVKEVLELPDMRQKGHYPYKGRATIAYDYYDGKDHKADTLTKFEGVYRPNQGIDYSKEKAIFDVYPIFAGTVVEVKEDAIFGNSITIESGPYRITYQSVADIKKKVKDHVMQKEIIAKSGVNVYHKELGPHLHVVVEKNGEIIDPKSLYGVYLNGEK